MSEVTLEQLRASTSALLRRVEAGERIVVTVNRRPVAALVPLDRRRSWVSAPDVWGQIGRSVADPGPAEELHRLLPDRVNDL